MSMEDSTDDPEVPDESDPEVLEEMFEMHKYPGAKPEDLPGARPVFRAKEAEWHMANQ